MRRLRRKWSKHDEQNMLATLIIYKSRLINNHKHKLQPFQFVDNLFTFSKDVTRQTRFPANLNSLN